MDVLIVNLPVLRQIGLSCFSDTQMRPGRCFAFDFFFGFCVLFFTLNSAGTKGSHWFGSSVKTQLGSANVSSDGKVG